MQKRGLENRTNSPIFMQNIVIKLRSKKKMKTLFTGLSSRTDLL